MADREHQVKSDEEIARYLQEQFEQEEKEKLRREEMDRKLAEAVAKGTHTLSDSDSDITIDPNSPSRQELNSDADSDITVDESGETENTTTKDKHKNLRGEDRGNLKLSTPLRKKTTMNIEELFGSDDSDDDQGNSIQGKKPVSLSSSATLSIHHVSDSDDGDGETRRTHRDAKTIAKPTSTTKRENSSQNAAVKRKHSGTQRQRCPYGMKCYRKNPSHFEEMIHPPGHANSIKEDRCSSNTTPIIKRQRTTNQPNMNSKNGSPASNSSTRVSHDKDRSKTHSNERASNGNKPHVEKRTSVNVPKVERQQTVPSTSSGNSMLQPSNTKQANTSTLRSSPSCLKPKPPDEVYRESLPLSFLLTKVAGIEPQFNHRLAMHIKGILSPCMGNLKRSAQFNYKFDIPWLVQQYPPEFRTLPLLVVHGSQREDKRNIESDVVAFDHVRLCQARLDIMFGTHHTKMMFLLYDKGMRVVIHTANMVQQDWYQKTQGIWISPVFPRLTEESAIHGDSDTNFKKDLLEYLAAYKASQLNDWMKVIREHDMSAAKVYIIGSVPGRHAADKKTHFGHLKLRKVLEQHGPEPQSVKDWPAIGQFSSVGSLGNSKEVWLTGELLGSLSSTKRSGPLSVGGGQKCKLSLIFPSKENVRQSLEGYAAGGSIPYSINVAKKQTYLHDFFHQWKSEVRGRSLAMPHIKTYTRVSPDAQKLAWFLVTSANMSKAAWGALEKNNSQPTIRSYEIGVLFIPKHFGDGHTAFKVMKNLEESDRSEEVDDELVFPVPYDFPLTNYFKQDKPWIWDIPYVDKPDTHMTKWCPPLK